MCVERKMCIANFIVLLVIRQFCNFVVALATFSFRRLKYASHSYRIQSSGNREWRRVFPFDRLLVTQSSWIESQIFYSPSDRSKTPINTKTARANGAIRHFTGIFIFKDELTCSAAHHSLVLLVRRHLTVCILLMPMKHFLL